MSKKMKIVLLVIITLCIIVGIVVLVNKNNTEKNIEETNGYNNELRVQRDNENVDTNEIRNEIEENMQKLKNNNV